MPSVKYRRRSDYIYKIQAFDLKHNYTVYQVTIRIQMSKYTIDIPRAATLDNLFSPRAGTEIPYVSPACSTICNFSL